jgi:hypothetical protein
MKSKDTQQPVAVHIQHEQPRPSQEALLQALRWLKSQVPGPAPSESPAGATQDEKKGAALQDGQQK